MNAYMDAPAIVAQSTTDLYRGNHDTRLAMPLWRRIPRFRVNWSIPWYTGYQRSHISIPDFSRQATQAAQGLYETREFAPHKQDGICTEYKIHPGLVLSTARRGLDIDNQLRTIHKVVSFIDSYRRNMATIIPTLISKWPWTHGQNSTAASLKQLLPTKLFSNKILKGLSWYLVAILSSAPPHCWFTLSGRTSWDMNILQSARMSLSVVCVESEYVA